MNHEDFERIRAVFEDAINYHRFLELKLESVTEERATISFPVKQELLGNPVKKILHGGVIASAIDVSGGVIAMVGMYKKHRRIDIEDAVDLFARMGTIDMRVDYLRPGTGQHFTCTGYTLRHGRTVTVVRSEFHNDQNELIAVGTGSYIVG